MICLVSNHKRLGYKCQHVILFLRSLGLYLYITAKYDMSFSLEQGRGTRRWTTSALGLWRNRGRVVNLHVCIFTTGSARVRHRRCRYTACRSAAKAVCGYNVPMILGTWISGSANRVVFTNWPRKDTHCSPERWQIDLGSGLYRSLCIASSSRWDP